MRIISIVLFMCIGLNSAVHAQAQPEGETVDMSGISIIGNRELPKTLFIVPWKNSEVGIESELTNTLDAGMRPVDRKEFVRELDYYDFSRNLQ